MSELDLSTRVVVLSPDAAGASQEAADLRDQGVEVVRVTTAYEAAAELIAAPAAALVVDLRLLGPRHLRLLTIARESQVEILAVGGLPPGMNSEDLSGVRLTSRADLPATLKKLTGGCPAIAAPAADEPAAQDDPPHALQEAAFDEEPCGDEDGQEPAPAELVPAKVSAEEIARERAGDYQPADPPAEPAAAEIAPPPPPSAQPAPPAPAPAQAAAPDEHRTLLTPEELAALLENEA
jgi:hypothetical protein